jgi:NAD-dependent DNA ligase/DNA polymerase/3'-5' exonuclease PolX
MEKLDNSAQEINEAIKKERKVATKKNKSPTLKRTYKLKIRKGLLNATDVVPKATDVVPKATDVMPKATDVMPKATTTIPLEPKTRLNEMMIEMLEKLVKLMKKNRDFVHILAYNRALETIRTINEDITDFNQLEGKKYIGPTIISKFKEYKETGTLSLFEREKAKPGYEMQSVYESLSQIYGIGPKKAEDLIKAGITSITELRDRQDELLNPSQKAGLKYYEDILERIPRKEIDDYNVLFSSIFEIVGTSSEFKYEIVGSYRRGKEESGDIDVIITDSSRDIFKNFIDELLNQGVILETLSRGPTKCLVITKLPPHTKARRVDFMFTPPEEYPFAILYFTGSKEFNTVMRSHALKQGLSLNEHGLSKKSKDKKVVELVTHKFVTEKDIFDYLRLVYKEPNDRINGQSVLQISDETKVENVVAPALTAKPILKLKIREPKNKTIKAIPESIVPILTTESSLKHVEKKTRKKREKKDTDQNPEKKNIKKNEDNKIQSMDTKKHIKDFKANGISVVESLSEKDVAAILIAANTAYYNTSKPLMTDNEFDIVKEYVERKFPNNPVLDQIGAPIQKNKVTLPYNMPSMDKIKPDTGALDKWKTKYKGPYVLSCKLDGVSGMYTTEGDAPKLYTRGDGKVGQDITHLLKILKLPVEKNIVVRGEFIIPKAVFDEKYKATFANPRNLVSGIVNSKTIDEKTRDLHFVTYEVIKPHMTVSEQMKKLSDLGFETVRNMSKAEISNEDLSTVLKDLRTNYEYEIDGIIVTDDNLHPRKDGNPEYAFAFKMMMSDQMAEAKVVDVLWEASKAGYLKPRVRIEPIRLGGITVEYATGFNAKFIEENKIGVGAVISIIRSGDVIPHIKSVTTPAETAKMPTEAYHWTETHVDIVLDNVGENVTVREKNITAFFSSLDVDGLSTGNVKRIMKAGFDSVPKILKMTKADFETVEGFKTTMVNKIYDGIHTKVGAATLLDIMVASNMFGRGIGERKIKPILEAFPNVLTTGETNAQKIAMLRTIPGIGPENAKSFVEHIGDFMAFLKDCDLEGKLLSNTLKPATTTDKNLDTSHPLYGKHVIMTKTRDQKVIDGLARVGGILDDTIGKKTDILIVKSHDDESNKTKYAKEHNIPIMTPEEFLKKYFYTFSH